MAIFYKETIFVNGDVWIQVFDNKISRKKPIWKFIFQYHSINHADTEDELERVKKILSSNKDAILNIRHEKENIKELCYLKLKNIKEIFKVKGRYEQKSESKN